VGDVLEEIIEAACHEVKTRGGAGLRLEHVAEACHVSVSLLYKYVNNRQELVLLGAGRWAAEEAAHFEADMTEIFSEVSTLDELATAALGYVVDQESDGYSGLRWGLAMGLVLSERHAEVVAESSRARAAGIATFTAAIERVMASAGGTPVISAAALARFLLSLWYGNLIAALNTEVERRPDEAIALVDEITLRVIAGTDVPMHLDPTPMVMIPGGVVFPEPKTRREAILRAATEEIVDVGMSEFMLKSVANRAGVTPSHVHYYFKSVADLIAAATVYRTDLAVEQWGHGTVMTTTQLTNASGLRQTFSEGARRALSPELRIFRHETIESLLIARNHPSSLAAAIETSGQIRSFWLTALDVANTHGLLKSDRYSDVTIASFIQTLVYGCYLFDDLPVTEHDILEWQRLYAVLAAVVMRD
jgi:AcrR family transcriptional regulator